MPTSLELDLITLARATPHIMTALTAVRGLKLPMWGIGAGAIRNMVWDHIHGYVSISGEIDIVYFDNASDLVREGEIQVQLVALHPELVWDVCNQALVHQWYEAEFGRRIAPFISLNEAIASWPETATAVAIRLEDDDSMTVIAPLGLDDLFAGIIRYNPRASYADFQLRIASKDFTQRWPRLTVQE